MCNVGQFATFQARLSRNLGYLGYLGFLGYLTERYRVLSVRFLRPTATTFPYLSAA